MLGMISKFASRVGTMNIFTDLWDTILNAIMKGLYGLYFGLVKAIAWVLDMLTQLFFIFAGMTPVSSTTASVKDGAYKKGDIVNFFLRQKTFQKAYLYLCLIALGLIIVFAIAKIIKQDYFDRSGPRSKGPIFRNIALSFVAFICIIPVFYFLIDAVAALAMLVMQAMGYKGGGIGSMIFNISWSDGGETIQAVGMASKGSKLYDPDNFGWYSSTTFYEYFWNADSAESYADQGIPHPLTNQMNAEFYWYIFIFTGLILIVNLGQMMLAMVTRMYNLIALFIVSPSAISQIVLDDGAKFKGWKDKVIQESLKVVGCVMSFMLFVMIVSLVNGLDLMKYAFTDEAASAKNLLESNGLTKELSNTITPLYYGAEDGSHWVDRAMNSLGRCMVIIAGVGAIKDIDATVTPFISGGSSSMDMGNAGKAIAAAGGAAAKGALELGKLGVGTAVNLASGAANLAGKGLGTLKDKLGDLAKDKEAGLASLAPDGGDKNDDKKEEAKKEEGANPPQDAEAPKEEKADEETVVEPGSAGGPDDGETSKTETPSEEGDDAAETPDTETPTEESDDAAETPDTETPKDEETAAEEGAAAGVKDATGGDETGGKSDGEETDDAAEDPTKDSGDKDGSKEDSPDESKDEDESQDENDKAEAIRNAAHAGAVNALGGGGDSEDQKEEGEEESEDADAATDATSETDSPVDVDVPEAEEVDDAAEDATEDAESPQDASDASAEEKAAEEGAAEGVREVKGDGGDSADKEAGENGDEDDDAASDATSETKSPEGAEESSENKGENADKSENKGETPQNGAAGENAQGSGAERNETRFGTMNENAKKPGVPSKYGKGAMRLKKAAVGTRVAVGTLTKGGLKLGFSAAKVGLKAASIIAKTALRMTGMKAVADEVDGVEKSFKEGIENFKKKNYKDGKPTTTTGRLLSGAKGLADRGIMSGGAGLTTKMIDKAYDKKDASAKNPIAEHTGDVATATSNMRGTKNAEDVSLYATDAINGSEQLLENAQDVNNTAENVCGEREEQLEVDQEAVDRSMAAYDAAQEYTPMSDDMSGKMSAMSSDESRQQARERKNAVESYNKQDDKKRAKKGMNNNRARKSSYMQILTEKSAALASKPEYQAAIKKVDEAKKNGTAVDAATLATYSEYLEKAQDYDNAYMYVEGGYEGGKESFEKVEQELKDADKGRRPSKDRGFNDEQHRADIMDRATRMDEVGNLAEGALMEEAVQSSEGAVEVQDSNAATRLAAAIGRTKKAQAHYDEVRNDKSSTPEQVAAAREKLEYHTTTMNQCAAEVSGYASNVQNVTADVSKRNAKLNKRNERFDNAYNRVKTNIQTMKDNGASAVEIAHAERELAEVEETSNTGKNAYGDRNRSRKRVSGTAKVKKLARQTGRKASAAQERHGKVTRGTENLGSSPTTGVVGTDYEVDVKVEMNNADECKQAVESGVGDSNLTKITRMGIDYRKNPDSENARDSFVAEVAKFDGAADVEDELVKAIAGVKKQDVPKQFKGGTVEYRKDTKARYENAVETYNASMERAKALAREHAANPDSAKLKQMEDAIAKAVSASKVIADIKVELKIDDK